MYKYRIYSQLKAYAKANKSFHIPGHKARGDFKKKFKCAALDVTELSYSDNLADPENIFASAQEELAEIVGAKISYILTDGSTSGVLAMVYALSRFGKKVIVFRGSHKSVWNACRLSGLDIITAHGGFDGGIMLPPSPEHIEKIIKAEPSVAGLIVTSPDYYGNVAPLEEYAKILHKNGKFLFVDGAHGAHLAFEKDKPNYAGKFADVWVDGAHKSLPALTQGALLCADRDEFSPLLEEGLKLFRTTSPSYPISASVEYAYKYMANNPEILRRARFAADKFKAECPFPLYPSKDWTKLAVDFGGDTRRVVKILENAGIYPEADDGKYIIFYLSPMTRMRDINKLLKVISKIKTEAAREVFKPVLPESVKRLNYIDAVSAEGELVPLSLAEGRVCAENAGLFPPCIPAVIAGEEVTKEVVNLLSSGRGTFGIQGGKIRVIKDEG